MKKPTFRLLRAAAVGCALLVGCSKNDEPKPPAAAAADATPKAPAADPATTTPVVTGAGPTDAKGPVSLKVKWGAGKMHLFRLEQTQDSEGSVPGLPQPIKTAAKYGVDYSLAETREIAGGGWELELALTGQQVESKMGETTTMTFDSKNPAAADAGNAIAETLRKAVGAKFKCQTDPAGKVQTVEGIPDFIKRISAGGDGQAIMAAKSMFNNDSLREMCSIGESLPDHPVKPGDTWTGKQDMDAEMIGKLAINLAYTFKGWDQRADHKCALIEYTGEITMGPGAPAANGVTATVENGKITGKIWFDPELGMLVENTGENTMSLKIKVLNQEMNSKVAGTATVKLMPAAK